MATTKPDSDNYLDRITGIQTAIVTGSQSSKYTMPSAPFPYWLNVFLQPRMRINTDNQSHMITYICHMALIRGNKASVNQEAIEAQILADMDDVLWGFVTDEDKRRLIVGTHTAIQPGFYPRSVRFGTMSRAEFTASNPTVSELLGSFYTLEWQHKMTRSLGS